MRYFVALLLTLSTCLATAADPAATSTTESATAARMQWWRDARFGMFIHWDMSSVAGTEISWSRKGPKPLDGPWGSPAGTGGDPVYDTLYKRFNPTKFDAKQWVKTAQDAGMQYIVFTAKHHGGFCMWDTKLTDYSIMHTPFKRDVVKELSDACHAAGMRFGLYYSPRDWHHPDYGVGDNAKYHAYLKGQLTELLTNYGNIDVVWFDSFGTGDSIKYWHADEILALVRKLQPRTIVNDRCSFFSERVPSLIADFDTPEGTVGKYQFKRPWESCYCLVDAAGGGWSYRPDGKVRSFDHCIEVLARCATGDGNLLLGIGPNGQGEIPAEQAERLAQIGQWTRKYGKSIYGTQGGPFRNGLWGGATFVGNKVYLHVLEAAQDTLHLPPLKVKLQSAKNLTGGAVEAKETDGRVTVTIPNAARVRPDTVIELTFDGPVSRVDGNVDVTTAALAGLKDVAGPDATITTSSHMKTYRQHLKSLLTGTCPEPFAFHTNEEKNPWVIIDLKHPQQIEAIQIENRLDLCQDRAKTLTLWLSDDGANWKEAWKAPAVADRWIAVPAVEGGNKSEGVTARYLKLGLQETKPTALHLRSVRIYGH